MKFSVDNIDFFGPLDLLLELIKAKKCDIRDIFIKDIISQYFSVVMKLEENSSENISNFIIMSSTLLEIKSKYLIYLDDIENEENPASELYDILEEYQKIRCISEKLLILYNKTPVFYENVGMEIVVKEELDLATFSITDLFNTFKKFIQTDIDVDIKNESRVISFKKASVEEKIKEIENWLIDVDEIYFQKFINGYDKDNAIASFLGILELSREQKIRLFQTDAFKEILIKRFSDGF